MCNAESAQMWVAVRVQRGFVTEAKAYWNEASARCREQCWRSQMNPDYDETGVLPVSTPTGGPPVSPRQPNSEAKGPKTRG